MRWIGVGFQQGICLSVVLVMVTFLQSATTTAAPAGHSTINPCQFRSGVYRFSNMSGYNDILELNVSGEQEVKGYYRQFQGSSTNARDVPADLDIWIDSQTARISCHYQDMKIELQQPGRSLSLQLHTSLSGDTVTACGSYTVPVSWRTYPRAILYAGMATAAAASIYYDYFQHGQTLGDMVTLVPVSDFFSVLVGGQANISFAEKQQLWQEQWAIYRDVSGIQTMLDGGWKQVLAPKIIGLLLWGIVRSVSSESTYSISGTGYFQATTTGACHIPKGFYYGRWQEQSVGEVDLMVPVGVTEEATFATNPRALWPWISVLNQEGLSAYHLVPSKMLCEGNRLLVECRDALLENSATLVLSYNAEEQMFEGFGLFMAGQPGSASFTGNSPQQFILNDIELRHIDPKVP